MQKTIYLLPEHPQLEAIEKLRERFDPSAHLIPAHITLVFPFASNVSDLYLTDLIDEVSHQFDPVEFALGHLICVDSYGFLPVTKGRRLISEMHDRLYGGELKPHLSGEYPYMPHITVGRYFNMQQCDDLRRACESASLTLHGTAEQVVLESIVAKGHSWVEHKARLRLPRQSDLDWLQTL